MDDRHFDIISRHALRHLKRHFVCVLRIEWRKVYVSFRISFVKRIRHDV